MRKRAVSVWLSAIFLFRAEGAPPMNYVENIRPIFLNSCLNCHNADKKKAGLDLSSYAAAMDGSDTGKVIEPGNASQSLLWRLVTHAEEPTMPAKSDKLADSQLDLIRQWIEAGAPEKAGSVVAGGAHDSALGAVTVETRPSGPPAMPRDLLLEPPLRASRAGAIAALAASPWAPLVAVGGQKQVLLFNTDTQELVGILPFPEGFPAVLKFSRDGQLLLAGGGIGAKLGRVVAWEVTTGLRVAEVGEEYDQVLAADLSPDHTRIALGGPNRLVKIYSARDGSLLHKMKKHTDWVTALAFTPDGKLLVTGDRAGGLVVWDAEGRDLQTMSAHQDAITSVVCAGNVVATASEDGTVKFWNVNEGKEIKSWVAHQGGVTALAAVPGGGFVTCGRDRVARLWDANGNRLREFAPFEDVALQTAMTGGKVVAGDWTGALRVWTPDGKHVCDWNANPPALAERVDAVIRRLAELQPQHESLLVQRQKLEEDTAKLSEEVRVASVALNAKETQVKAVDTQIVLLTKNAAEGAAAVQQARAEMDRIEKNAELLASNSVHAAETLEAAVRQQNETLKELQKKEELATHTAEAARDAQAGADQKPEDKALAETAVQAKAAAEKATEDLAAGQKLKSNERETAQRLAEAAAQAKAAEKENRQTQNVAQQTSLERTATANVAQAELAKARADAGKLHAELADLKKTLPAKLEQGKTVETALVKVRQNEEATRQQLAAARAELTHWRAAQVNVELHAAQDELAKWTAAPATDNDATKKLETAKAKVDQITHHYAALRQEEDAAHTLTLASQK